MFVVISFPPVSWYARRPAAGIIPGLAADVPNTCSPYGKAASVRAIGSRPWSRSRSKRLDPEDRARLLAWLLLYFNDDGMLYSPQISRRRQRITLDGVEYWLARVPKQVVGAVGKKRSRRKNWRSALIIGVRFG